MENNHSLLQKIAKDIQSNATDNNQDNQKVGKPTTIHLSAEYANRLKAIKDALGTRYLKDAMEYLIDFYLTQQKSSDNN